MTERLYYNDPYSREFDATVTRAEPRNGDLAVWLDRSSFYPTSGGQPFDTGVLNRAAVVDVIEEDGDVLHVVRGATFVPGTAVHGVIDWARRFDHMQQHTGQHLLSAAFVRTADVPTSSFHMGADLSTIDLARDARQEEIALAEQEANDVVWRNLDVWIRYTDANDAAGLGLRKASKRAGTLRLIEIEDFDLSACGGAHVTKTGAVGIIVVAGWERFKGGTRVQFACGRRALRRFGALRDSVAAATRLLSVQPSELPTAIDRLQADLRLQRKAMADAERELATYRADSFAAAPEIVSGVRLVVRAVEGGAQALHTIASAVVVRSGFVAVLVSTSVPAALVVARAADVAAVSSDAIVRAVCQQCGGRGGGKPDFAQAGGLSGPTEAILSAALASVKNAILAS